MKQSHQSKKTNPQGTVNLRYEDCENSISYFGVDVFSVMAVLCSAGRTAVEDRLTGFCGTANEEIAD